MTLRRVRNVLGVDRSYGRIRWPLIVALAIAVILVAIQATWLAALPWRGKHTARAYLHVAMQPAVLVFQSEVQKVDRDSFESYKKDATTMVDLPGCSDCGAPRPRGPETSCDSTRRGKAQYLGLAGRSVVDQFSRQCRNHGGEPDQQRRPRGGDFGERRGGRLREPSLLPRVQSEEGASRQDAESVRSKGARDAQRA